MYPHTHTHTAPESEIILEGNCFLGAPLLSNRPKKSLILAGPHFTPTNLEFFVVVVADIYD
jgi:hypothetical protein